MLLGGGGGGGSDLTFSFVHVFSQNRLGLFFFLSREVYFVGGVQQKVEIEPVAGHGNEKMER